MLGPNELGQADIVRSPQPSPTAAQELNLLVRRAWSVAGISNWRRWIGRSEDPMVAVIQAAYALGKKDAQG